VGVGAKNEERSATAPLHACSYCANLVSSGLAALTRFAFFAGNNEVQSVVRKLTGVDMPSVCAVLGLAFVEDDLEPGMLDRCLLFFETGVEAELVFMTVMMPKSKATSKNTPGAIAFGGPDRTFSPYLYTICVYNDSFFDSKANSCYSIILMVFICF
jgi:hypothetical protein